MGQFLKSEMLWQLVGGFGLGTVMLIALSPADGVHTALKHLTAVLGLS
ncbi:hypothetical protein ACLB0R_03705 [Sphingomonas sp. GlSt437]|jgi:hypothetical protein